MAVAAPKRRTAPAPAPSRTTAPKKRKKAPARAGAAAAPRSRAAAAPAAVPSRAPARRAPARAPQRAKPKTRRNPGALVIPFAGRTAVAVGQLPDSGLMVRMTRGRLWIGVLGVLLIGIVGLNVVNLSFSAKAAKIDAQITAVASENHVLEGREATRYSTGRMTAAGRAAGFTQPPGAETLILDFGPDTVARAAQRLAAASP